MKITIDTKEDSHEEIRKVIRMLQHLVGETSYSNERVSKQRNIFEDSSPSIQASPSESASPQPGSAFAAMFNNNSPISSEEAKPKEYNYNEIPEVIEYND